MPHPTKIIIRFLETRKLRQALKGLNASVHNPPCKPTQKPTTRWVFQYYSSLDILLVKRNVEVTLRQLLNVRLAQE